LTISEFQITGLQRLLPIDSSWSI